MPWHVDRIQGFRGIKSKVRDIPQFQDWFHSNAAIFQGDARAGQAGDGRMTKVQYPQARLFADTAPGSARALIWAKMISTGKWEEHI